MIYYIIIHCTKHRNKHQYSWTLMLPQSQKHRHSHTQTCLNILSRTGSKLLWCAKQSRSGYFSLDTITVTLYMINGVRVHRMLENYLSCPHRQKNCSGSNFCLKETVQVKHCQSLLAHKLQSTSETLGTVNQNEPKSLMASIQPQSVKVLAPKRQRFEFVFMLLLSCNKSQLILQLTAYNYGNGVSS